METQFLFGLILGKVLLKIGRQKNELKFSIVDMNQLFVYDRLLFA